MHMEICNITAYYVVESTLNVMKEIYGNETRAQARVQSICATISDVHAFRIHGTIAMSEIFHQELHSAFRSIRISKWTYI